MIIAITFWFSLVVVALATTALVGLWFKPQTTAPFTRARPNQQTYAPSGLKQAA